MKRKAFFLPHGCGACLTCEFVGSLGWESANHRRSQRKRGNAEALWRHLPDPVGLARSPWLRYSTRTVDDRRPKPSVARISKLILGIVCVGLVLLSATVQVAHSHLDNNSSHPGCALCVLAHVAGVAVAPQVIPVIATFVSLLQVASPVARPTVFFTFALFTRPPPASAFPA